MSTNNKELEIKFHKDMINIYEKAKEIGYNASRYKQMVANQGGLNVAKKFIKNNNPSDGFVSLWELNRLDLTVEALIIRDEYKTLFSPFDRKIVIDRLKEYGFKIPKESDDEVETIIEIPKLEPKSRSREYNSYKDEIKDEVIYEFLFNAKTHRWLDENIIGMDADYSRGYQSMGILHYIGLKDKHKGLFQDFDINEAIEQLKPESISGFSIVIDSLQRMIDKEYSNEINVDIDEEREFAEGKEAYRIHRYKERDPKLVKEAKKMFKQKHGELFCEACDIRFEKVYGERGKDYIEAHHTKPVSEMIEGEKTKVEDIAMLCSNCHRMIHRDPMISVNDLRSVISENSFKNS